MTERDLSFKGVQISTLGAVVLEQPRLKRGEERLKEATVPGRSGVLHLAEGDRVLSQYPMTAVIGLPEGMSYADRAALLALLQGEGTVIFGSDESHAYEAVVTGALELEAILEGREWDQFSVVFSCQPYRYHLPEAADITLTGAALIDNPGTADAAPLYAITGTGEVYFSVGSESVFIDFGETERTLVLDAETQMAFLSDYSARADGDIEGGIPLIPAGSGNAVSWTGTVSAAVITPRWRDL